MTDKQTNAASGRLLTLDVLRGVAVMGILLMNIIAFSMPEAAYINPMAWGGTTPADFWAWALSYVFVDGKMRALFSILFGASMLLFIERAEARGRDSGRLHLRRMLWLALFGLVHYALIWDGDILFLYAVIGLVAYLWRNAEARTLINRGVGLIILSCLFWGIVMGAGYLLKSTAEDPKAKVEEVKEFRSFKDDMGSPGSKKTKRDIEIHRSNYAKITEHRAVKEWEGPLALVLLFGIETLGLMALGMGLLKNGFLTGGWDQHAYRRWALIGVGGSAILLSLLAWKSWSGGFEILWTASATVAFGGPFRAPMAMGYVALGILALQRWRASSLMRRLAATGQAAFTNYIGTSLLMTTLFYGYGFGLYGHVSRAWAYVIVLCTCLLMLFWSKIWMDRYRHGPLEWVWRSLTRWEKVPLQR